MIIQTCRARAQFSAKLHSGLMFAISTSLFALGAGFVAPSAFSPAAAQGPEFQQQPWDIEEPADTASDPWPFAASDLPLDADYRFGVLDNGMRYIIRPNGTPEGQGMVQFWVDAGSINETDDERGFAHFIEHMAFNGSTKVPEGEMIKLLEREGLAFGADTNASTGFDATVYKLDLPRNDEDLLGTALMLMRETASELTISQDAVDREKGVVLSERRVRDTFSMQNTIDGLQFQYPGSRLSNRLPIGTIESLEGATAQGLRGFWERWYRPDNSAIIVVGDFDADDVEAKIKQQFSDWTGDKAPEKPDFGPIDPAFAGKNDIYLDPALSESLSISRNGEDLTVPDTVASRRARVLRQIGYGIINRRLSRLSREDAPPFRGAGFGSASIFEAGRSTDLTVNAHEGEWKRGLAAAQLVYRQALQFGFSPAEVAEQTANLRSAIQSNAASAATRSNGSFIRSALTLLGDDQIPTTPQSSLERFNAHEPLITPGGVLAALTQEALALDNPLIRFEGRTAPEGGAQALRAAWDEGMTIQMEPPEQARIAQFAYTNFGDAGTIVSDTREATLDIRTLVFSNGLKLNLKPTALQDEVILLSLNIDGGDMLNTRENPLATAVTGNLPTGGLSMHTIDELQTILAGKQVGFSIASAGKTFTMGGRTVPDDIELQLQLFTAAMVDAAYRPQAEIQYAQNVENFFARRDATPNGALGARSGSILSDGDPRHSLQEKEAYLALTMEKLRNDITDRLVNGAIELGVVGDFDEDEVIALVSQTLGALPLRESEFRDYADNSDRSFTADRSQHTIYHDGAEDQALLSMVWPTRDDSDFEEHLTLELLERVVQILLTDSLREELGATYSPDASASQSRIHTGYGSFIISAAIDIGDVDATRVAINSALLKTANEPVSTDIIQRARAPMAESYDNGLKTNNGWMSLVRRAQSQSQRITRFNRGKELLESITAEQLQSMAKRYLGLQSKVEFVVLPRPKD